MFCNASYYVCLLCDIPVLVLVEIGEYHDMHFDETKPVCTCRDGTEWILIVHYLVISIIAIIIINLNIQHSTTYIVYVMFIL